MSRSTVQRARRWLFGLALALPLGAWAAPVQNGDFEGGDLGGWKLSGYGAALAGPASTWLPGSTWQAAQGEHSAVVIAMSTYGIRPEFPCSQDLWNLNCPEPATRVTGDGTTPTYADAYHGGPVTGPSPVNFSVQRGGSMGQDLVVGTGDVLSWDWACIGQVGDCIPFDSWDNAWFYATNGAVGYGLQMTGSTLTSASFTFTDGGLWSVYFGIGQRDPWFWSGLLVDNVRLSEVDEPASIALVGAALLALFGGRRRRRS